MANENIEELQKKAEKMLEEASKARELSDDEVEQVVGGMLKGPEFYVPAKYRAFFCPACGGKAVYFLGECEYLEEAGCSYLCRQCLGLYHVSLNKATGKFTAMTANREIIEIKESIHGGEPITSEEAKRLVRP